jgi:hypothetical protein
MTSTSTVQCAEQLEYATPVHRDRPTDAAALDRILETVRSQIHNLALAIDARDYLTAWLDARELGRMLCRAEAAASRVSGPSGNAEPLRRWREVNAAAMPNLARAPAPTALAIRQARSACRSVDRSAWDAGEQAWLTACDAARAVNGRSLRGKS